MTTPRALRVYTKLASIRLGTLIAKYKYDELRRFFEHKAQGLSKRASIDDPLQRLLFKGLRNTKAVEKIIMTSLDTLLRDVAKSYHPVMFVSYNLRDGKFDVVAALTACDFVHDAALMTEDLASKKRLPKFDRAWVLIDKLSGKTRGINALMVLHLFVHAVKQRGIVAVAVTDEGQAFFTNMGFTVVTLPEKNDVIRRICYLETSSLNMEDVQRCLGMDDIIFDICWRKGLSSATADKRIARC